MRRATIGQPSDVIAPKHPPCRSAALAKVRSWAERAASILLLLGTFLTACGSTTASPKALGGQAGTLAAAGRTNAVGGAGDGGTEQDSQGESQGGDPTTTPATPTLGGDCTAPGTLACAGAHQKLTLVCGGDHLWEINQTCGPGQFCASTDGPNLGICVGASPECTDREPNALVCVGDHVQKCDQDALTSSVVESCEVGCTDGTCAKPSCPPSLLFSCAATCADATSTCYDLCGGPADDAQPPLLDIAGGKAGDQYRVILPTFDEAPACACAGVAPAMDAVAFRLPTPPAGLFWKIQVPAPWTLEIQRYEIEPDRTRGNGCERLALAMPCYVWDYEAIVWAGTFKVSPQQSQLTVTLVEGVAPCE